MNGLEMLGRRNAPMGGGMPMPPMGGAMPPQNMGMAMPMDPQMMAMMMRQTMPPGDMPMRGERPDQPRARIRAVGAAREAVRRTREAALRGWARVTPEAKAARMAKMNAARLARYAPEPTLEERRNARVRHGEVLV